MQEVEFGLDPIEIIVRIKGEDVNTFNQLNELSIDQLKSQLSGKETACYFQKVSEREHRIIAPLNEGFLVLAVSEHEMTGTYEAIVRQKLKTCYTAKIILPDTDRLIETCTIRIIDINETGKNNRTSDELEALQKKIDRLPIASIVNIANQQAIWNKWIEAQQAILESLQKPYEVKSNYKVSEVKSSNGNVIRYTIKFEHANEILPEYNLLEQKLKTLDVDVKISDEGSVLLTKNEIEILDAVIRREFPDSIERNSTIAAIVPIKPVNESVSAKNKLPQGINAIYNEHKRLLSVSGTIDDAAKAAIDNAGFNHKYTLTTFEIINHGDILKNDSINKKYNITFGGNLIKTTGKGGYFLPMPTNNRFVRKEIDPGKLKWTLNGLGKIYGRDNVVVSEVSVYEPKEKLTTQRETSAEQFWTKLKRDLYMHNLEDAVSEDTGTVYLEYNDEEQLREQVRVLTNLTYVHIVYSPLKDDFKFKVRVNASAKKSQQELFLEKLKMLRGADFVVEVAEEDKKKPRLQYLGAINGFESDLKKLVLNLPCVFPDQKREAKEVLKFLNAEEKPVITSIRANLTGDAAKMSWLEFAVSKITKPTEAPNGKPINAKLGEFIFDTSKADPIFDERKLDENSEAYQSVKANELLKLNESQRKAVISAINCTDLALLQGPPGTGKTTVIAEMIWQIISNNPQHRILLTSETNLAVDNALDRLLNTKGVNPSLVRYTTIIKPLRFGRMLKMDEEGAKYSAERILKWSGEADVPVQEYVATLDENDPSDDENVEKNDPENNAVQDWMTRIAGRAKYNDPKYANALKDWAIDLTMPTPQVKKLFTDKYFEYSNIVGSTCSSAGSPNFMWDYAKYMLNKDVDVLGSLYRLAQKAPASRKFRTAVSDLNLSDDIIRPYIVLWREYGAEEEYIKRHFATPGSEAEALPAKSFPTIDNKPIKSLADTKRLISFAKLTEYSKKHFAPYFEEKVEFDTVIMDEASKATPPELLLPLCFGKRSIVIGDHRQLPPMLNEKDFKEALKEAGAEELSNEIDREFTETSQFERMILNPKVSKTIISRCNIQYRMHPDINEVIKQFYIDEGGLEPSPELLENANVPELSNPFSRHHGLYLDQFIDPNTHTIWVNVKTPETREGTSVTNEGEIQAIKMVMQLLKKASGFTSLQKHWEYMKDDFKRQQEQQVGIISFYGAQKRLIKRSLTGIGIPLKIDTVDRFQGMERNIIVVSTVRSDKQTKFGGKTTDNKDSGFAKSPQRLNVALSRARRLLIVVGNKEFFEQVTDTTGRPLYKNAISAMENRGRIIDFETLKKLAK
ncbi:MAG: AAA family ATPase [Bacteroidetes bacterium]|nr:AAA family ATPase [Bacteroidota bacterium]